MDEPQAVAFQSSHWQALAGLWRQQMLCDVQLRAATGELLPAHGIVLASCSGFFRYSACTGSFVAFPSQQCWPCSSPSQPAMQVALGHFRTSNAECLHGQQRRLICCLRTPTSLSGTLKITLLVTMCAHCSALPDDAQAACKLVSLAASSVAVL